MQSRPHSACSARLLLGAAEGADHVRSAVLLFSPLLQALLWQEIDDADAQADCKAASRPAADSDDRAPASEEAQPQAGAVHNDSCDGLASPPIVDEDTRETAPEEVAAAVGNDGCELRQPENSDATDTPSLSAEPSRVVEETAGETAEDKDETPTQLKESVHEDEPSKNAMVCEENAAEDSDESDGFESPVGDDS
jgi:hypothetical protein